MTDYIVPVLLFLAAALALGKRENAYDLLLQGGTDGAAAEQHVIYKDDLRVVHRGGDARLADVGLAFQAGPVVTVQVDVQRAQGQGALQLLLHQGAQTAGQVGAAAFDAHQHDALALPVPFQHFAGKTFQNTGHFLFVQQQCRGHNSSRSDVFPYAFLAAEKSPASD